jgi:hypothetical protein
MSLEQLKAYRDWLESERVLFMNANPTPKIEDPGYTAQIAWYKRELLNAGSWIEIYEGNRVNAELDRKAKNFINPPGKVTQVGPESSILKARVEDFKYFMQSLFKGPF